MGDKNIHVGGNMIGGAAVTGDHNVTTVTYRKVTLPPADSIDIEQRPDGRPIDPVRQLVDFGRFLAGCQRTLRPETHMVTTADAAKRDSAVKDCDAPPATPTAFRTRLARRR